MSSSQKLERRTPPHMQGLLLLLSEAELKNNMQESTGPLLMKIKHRKTVPLQLHFHAVLRLADSRVHWIYLPIVRLLPPSLTRQRASIPRQTCRHPRGPFHALQDQNARQHRRLRCSVHVQLRDLPVALPDSSWP